MAIQDSGKRFIGKHPHTGRAFIVGDTITIKDIWDCSDAYQNALRYGSTWVDDSGIVTNSGNFRNVGTSVQSVDANMHHEPVAGMSGGEALINTQSFTGFRYITQRYVSAYTADYLGELNSQHDSYALALDFRFLSEAEFSTSALPSGSNGVGARAQRLTIYLYERSQGNIEVVQGLVDIFYDYNYYVANVGATAFLPYAIDLSQGGASGLEQSGTINTALFIDKIGATLRKNAACAARIQARYELPRAANGAAWGTQGVFNWNNADAIEHQGSGITDQAWGVLSLVFTCFMSTTYTAPTLAAGQFSRPQTAFPLTADATMGQNLDTLVFQDLFFRGRAAAGVSWPSVFIGKRDFGGLPRIMVGDWARYQLGTGTGAQFAYDDQLEQVLETRCQLPANATRFTLHTLVRFIGGAGTHTIKVELTREFDTSPFIAVQTLWTNAYSVNTPQQFVWVDQPLSANMLPTAGVVEHCKLVITVTKSVPRNANFGYPKYAPSVYNSQPSTVGFWDGMAALYLAFR